MSTARKSDAERKEWRFRRAPRGPSGQVQQASAPLAAQRIPIEGRYRQEGEGNSAATVGAVLAAGVIGGLIVTGKTARIPEGREFTVHTVDAIPATAGAGNGVPALIAASYAPSAVNLQVMTDKERKALEKATKAAQRKAERKRA